MPPLFSVVLCLTTSAALVVFCGEATYGQVQAARDGGTHEVLVSIFVPPLVQAPFSLTLGTEWTRPLNGGGTYTAVNSRHIERDSRGRIYQERWVLVPKGGKVKSFMTSVEISDPDAHTRYNCVSYGKTCYLVPYTQKAVTTYQPAPGQTGPNASGDTFSSREELGSGAHAGIETQGYRETTTINAGVYGNDRPMVTTREYWFAPKLGINMLSRLDSPQSGLQTFTVTSLSLSEPEPDAFVLPEGFAIVDQRKEEPSSR